MSERNQKRIQSGNVVSISGNQTIAVLVSTLKKHTLYKKVIKSSKKYLVHDENNEAKIGDRVSIMECRPISKTKRWRLISQKKAATKKGAANK